MTEWLHGRVALREVPEGAHGFTYKLTYIDPETAEVSRYIGKKNFFSVRNVKKGKRELAAMTDQRGSKKKKVIKESDWRKYQSSHTLLKRVNAEHLEKEVLTVCFSKTELTYQETRELFVHKVLDEDSRYLNDNILGKFYKSK
jgi:ABC-type Fe3+/spermidine/putrescine transport system ATPase subunit